MMHIDHIILGSLFSFSIAWLAIIEPCLYYIEDVLDLTYIDLNGLGGER